MIDLLKLHDNNEDKNSYSWIVADGPELFTNFKLLIDKVIEKSNCSVKSLSNKVSRRIGCSNSMLYDILNRRTQWISLVLINDILTILGENGGGKEIIKLKNRLLNSIKFLKSTPRSTVKIKAVKNLSKDLAEFCGIHAADGSLNLAINIETKKKATLAKIKNRLHKAFPKIRISKIKRTRSKTKYGFYFYIVNKTRTRILKYLNRHTVGFSLSYKIEFVDSGGASMKHLKKLIANQFGYNIKIKTQINGNWYYVLFSGKIIGRYLKNIFNFPLGRKSEIVEAPNLIQESSFNTQKAFIRGLMQFDGSVKRNGRIALSTNSKHLLNFFLKVVAKDRLSGVVWFRKGRKKELMFESPPSKQWLDYFIKNTLKYQRLYENIYGFKEKVKSLNKVIKVFDVVFPSTNKSTQSFTQLIKIVSKLKEFTRYQIAGKLNIHYKSLSSMLDILENARVVKVDCVTMSNRFKGESDKITFNHNIEEWRAPLLKSMKQ